MATDRGNIMTAASVIGGAAAAFFGFAWPHYRAASDIQFQIAHLELRIATSDEQHISLDALVTRLSAAKNEYESALREIPVVPDMAGLMRTFSSDGNQRNGVAQQTVTFGRPAADPAIEDGSINILPLTVDMTANFGPVFELLARAERMDRLVRVASILVERSKEFEELLDATVRLEAVFEAPEVAPEVE
jgi:Tfp pilus assembly protein PilO